MNDESRKKLMAAEVKIKQLTNATIKDLKTQIKEKSAEVEILKEMVKSSNMQVKAKDIDIQRLNKKLGRQGESRNYSADRSEKNLISSRAGSRLSQGDRSPKPNDYLINSIAERDEIFEQTGGDPYY